MQSPAGSSCVSTKHGELQHTARRFDRVDIGNYRRSEVYLVANSLIAAREHGDDEIAEAALDEARQALSARLAGGVLSFQSSTQIGAQLVMGHLVRRDDWRNARAAAGHRGRLPRPGLDREPATPTFSSARAWSGGEDLSLVLYPGGPSAEQVLGVDRLAPGRTYRLEPTGATFVADRSGRADVPVSLHDRTDGCGWSRCTDHCI